VAYVIFLSTILTAWAGATAASDFGTVTPTVALTLLLKWTKPARTLNLIFSASNATQITWSDDVTGQNLQNSDDQMVVPLPWPDTGCQTRFISVRYFDSVLGVFRICCIEVEVCRSEICNDNDFVDNCNDFEYFRLGLGSYAFTSAGEVAENENWLINRVPSSEAGYPATTTQNTLSCVFPEAGTYEICYPFP